MNEMVMVRVGRLLEIILIFSLNHSIKGDMKELAHFQQTVISGRESPDSHFETADV